MIRTSETHPIRVDSLAVGPGRLGLTFCPGKQGDSLSGDPWARDLATDVAALAGWGAETVLTLTETDEMAHLGVPDLGATVQAAGMAWRHLPIPDLGAPDRATLSAWQDVAPELHRSLDAGARLVVHCRGGLGRAGTISALMLVERGASAAEAMATVRAVRPGAIETSVQERFLAARAAVDPRTARVRAALFGCAMGDALGADIEFDSLARIRARFPDGLTALPAHDGRIGAITDDTQMTLFTAEGLIRAMVRGTGKGICHPPSVVHHALLRWFVTQGGRPQHKVDGTGLVTDPRLHRRRAPGTTIMGALGAAQQFGTPARNDSKGCGTIMRVAPVAFFAPDRFEPERVEALAMETSALTHGHRTGQEAAAAWALILRAVLEGAEPEAAAGRLLGRFGAETDDALRAALSAWRDGRAGTVETLGGGWIAEEALAIALYAVLAAGSAEQALRIAVTHSGDSDSTGAIAGTLAGLVWPDEIMAHRWRAEVECADLIDRLARDLMACPGWDEDAPEASAYPGW